MFKYIKMTTNLTTVNINKESQKELKKLSKIWGGSQVESLNSMIWYFKKTGIDPKSPIYSPMEEIARLEKRLDQVIKFLRYMENEKLSPLLDELIISERRLKDFLASNTGTFDYKSFQPKLSEIENLIKNIESNSRKNQQYIIQEISKINQAFIKDITKNRVMIEESKVQISQLLKIFFEAMNNRSITGKLSEEDIKKFEYALYKV